SHPDLLSFPTRRSSDLFSGRNAFAKHSKHDRSRLFEIARVLVRFDQVARFITNPNHSAVERIEIRQSRARGVRKTAALRNKNTRSEEHTSELQSRSDLV